VREVLLGIGVTLLAVGAFACLEIIDDVARTRRRRP
jgi:hypothetical protein